MRICRAGEEIIMESLTLSTERKEVWGRPGIPVMST
jgi:hypothetical protein